MSNRNLIETVMGAVVLAVAALFVQFAYSTAQVRTAPGYEVTATFSTVGGLAPGADVRVSGIRVGRVSDSRLDERTFNAVVTLSVENGVKLPTDTVAVIASEGPLGGRYLELRPGRASTMIPEGGAIAETRAYRSLEDQVGEIIFLATGRPGGGDNPGAPEPSAGPSAQ